MIVLTDISTNIYNSTKRGKKDNNIIILIINLATLRSPPKASNYLNWGIVKFINVIYTYKDCNIDLNN